MTARYGSGTYDNPYSAGREQVFGDELPPHRSGLADEIEPSPPPPGPQHEGWPGGEAGADYLPAPDWTQDQLDTYSELLEVGYSMEEAWIAAVGLSPDDVQHVTAERDWTYVIGAVLGGIGLTFLAARSAPGRRRAA